MTAFLADPIAKEHDAGLGHPECPARWDAAVRGLAGPLHAMPSRAATHEELLLCHTSGYIETARREATMGLSTLSTGDTDICEESYDAALHAAGVCLNAVDLVMTKAADNAFCVVRPPGHHASAERGMGFCLFNSIAIAARYAQRRYGAQRVVIADWDVHHGNGTQDIFYDDDSVFFFSTHEWPLYPGTGAMSENRATTLNCPFPAGAGRDQIVCAFREQLLPAMESFRPDLVLISAGFDSRIGDPLGHFQLTDEDFAELTSLVMKIGPVVSVLEGGYNLNGLTRAVAAHTAALSGTA